MARIREEDIQAVRERTDIVKVVSQYLTLKKAGHDRLVGLCPFHAEAASPYHRTLLEGREGADARAYLAGRGIDREAAAEFEIGYAPMYPDFLLRRLAQRFSPEILVEAGLAARDGSGGVRDRFRGR